MDFSIFDRMEHMTALTWLGRREWFTFKDVPEQRAISVSTKKLLIKPTAQQIAANPDALTVSDKQFRTYPPQMWDKLTEIMEALPYDVIGALWYDTLSKSLAGGPKIFRPTPDQCEALENAEARYSFNDYHQPFPVIILDIPKEYQEHIKQTYEIKDAPSYVLVNHDEKNRFITVSAFYNRSNIITHITLDRYETIEDSLQQNREHRHEIIPTEDSAKEFLAAECVQRLGINFAMMMSLYSVKVTETIDQSKFRMWEREAKARNKQGDFTKNAIEAQAALAANIKLIEFNQQVSFYDEIEEDIPVAQGVDIDRLHKSPKSHWRRGHFANIACGIGRKDRKMIFRKPILVRAKYFIGDLKDASVTYTMNPARDIPQEQLAHTPFQMPKEEPFLKEGQTIRITDAEDVPAGVEGIVLQVQELGSSIFRITVESGETLFTLLSPPDKFETLN